MLAASGGGAATYAYDAMVARSKRVSIDNLCNGLIAGLVASSWTSSAPLRLVSRQHLGW